MKSCKGKAPVRAPKKAWKRKKPVLVIKDSAVRPQVRGSRAAAPSSTKAFATVKVSTPRRKKFSKKVAQKVIVKTRTPRGTKKCRG